MHVNDKNEPVCIDSAVHTGIDFNRQSVVVGVTGGIATGKSTICSMFKELGAEVISADEIVHCLLINNENIINAVKNEFGAGILNNNGEINRKSLGRLVFSDYEKLRKLEDIIHPFVLCSLSELSADFRKNGKGILIMEIPLLIETRSMHMVDKVIVVSSEQKTQVERLRNRTSMSLDEAWARVRSQLSIENKKKFADWVVNTEESTTNNREHIRRIWCALQNILAHTK